MLRRNSRPMPGTLKMPSMMIEPVMRPAVAGPTIVAIGIIAFFMTCAMITTCARGTDVVLADRLEHAGPRDSCQEGHRTEREDDRREDPVEGRRPAEERQEV